MVIGTVYESPGRQRVIELDDEGHADAQAWAIVAALPEWVIERYRNLVLSELDSARGGGGLS